MEELRPLLMPQEKVDLNFDCWCDVLNIILKKESLLGKN